MRLLNPSLYLLSFFLFATLLQHSPTIATKKSYVVYMGEHSHGPELTSDDLNQVTLSHHEFLASFLDSNDKPEDDIFYSYTRHINGFAAHLDDAVAAKIAKHPKVVSVFLNQGNELHTTHSWGFLGLEKDGQIPSNSIWNKARYGEDTIIGNLDTGVWPESKSFSDEGYGPIPFRWNGTCQNEEDTTFKCNRKLIGARYFKKGYEAVLGRPLNSFFKNPRDNSGHGTHTLSTVGGNFVAEASVLGLAKGTAKGGSPKARVAAYKVCWPPVDGKKGKCYDADILKAFDTAIEDRVDVLSMSLGGKPRQLKSSGIAIGSFHAVKNGIVVVASAGNSGPDDYTVSNVAPWLITVGASTIDREFDSYVVLGNKKFFKGQSLSTKTLPPNKFFPLISAADAKAPNASIERARRCEYGALDKKMVNGKILVCLYERKPRVNKGEQALLAGAVGMVLVNDETTGNEVIAKHQVLPASHIGFTNGVALSSYINSTKTPVAYITPPTTRIGAKPAPFMAPFSSKGPNSITPEILKPDITAPGVNILADYTHVKGPTDLNTDKRRTQFNIISGTSMSCPHVSGIVGLLKTLYPHWSPAAIKSAIMTTATTLDNSMESILNSSYFKATPFSYGAGHVQPNRVLDPGLVYDLNVQDYLNFLCATGNSDSQISNFTGKSNNGCSKSFSLTNFNYPSITVPNLSGSITVTRKAKNVGSPGTYVASVKQPEGISVSVQPKRLVFKMVGEEKSFNVTLKVEEAGAAKDYVFGDLIWSDDKQHQVRSPIVVKVV